MDAASAARLRLAVTRLGRRLRKQADGDLTSSQLSAFFSVAQHGPITLGDLSAVEGVRPPTITRIVTELERRGLISRRPEPSDRRVSWVELTLAGKRLVTKTSGQVDVYLASRLQILDKKDRRTLEQAIPVLERLVHDDVDRARPDRPRRTRNDPAT